MFERIAEAYAGRTAVVIGAGGIGRAIVRMLVGEVGRLVVADRDEKLLASLATEHAGDEILTQPLDVRDGLAVADFFAFVQRSAGTPDFLFYTVGVLNIEPFAQTTDDLWNRAVDVNLNGAYYCTKAASDRMRLQKRGSILILGSIAGIKARSGTRVHPVYNSTKAALAAFVNATAMQLRKDGVRINGVSPGPTDTSLMRVQPDAVLAAVDDISLDGRMCSPEEVAETALFVAAHGRFTGEDVAMGGGAGLGG